jgi:DNA-binding XRE family transcriptional regulator
MDKSAKLVKLLRAKLAKAVIEEHPHKSGNVEIDLEVGRRSFAIEYWPDIGFGLTSLDQPDGDRLFDTGSDEIYLSPSEVVERVVGLIRSKEHTKLHRPLLLQEIRAALGVTQTELAQRLEMKQPTLSKIEKQGRLQLGTLQRYIRALGGNLKLVADVGGQQFEVRMPLEPEALAHED